MSARQPLDLYAEVTTASGARYKWDANQAPGSRLRNFSFRTKIGEGFSDASGQLARRIDQDYPDLNLVNTVTVVGADGSVAYEGRLAAMPRDLSDTHSIGVTLAGWMAHAKDRKFTEIYVDRDLGAWHGVSVARRAQRIGEGYILVDGTVASDPGTNLAAVILPLSTDTWLIGNRPHSEIVYDAGSGNSIGRLHWEWGKGTNVDSAFTGYAWSAWLMTNDTYSVSDTSGNLRGFGPGSGDTDASDTGRRYAALQFFSTDAYGTASQKEIYWSKLAVYGKHGLTPTVGEPGEPGGLVLSDLIRDIASRWCPQLDVSSVQDHSYVVQHCAFKDRTFPYDAFLELNKYALWHLGVWENKTLHFRPYDLSDYDWEIRTDDPGTTFSPQGPSTEDLFNGTVVTYTDLLTGIQNVLTPDAYTQLADTSATNPWNQHGVAHWDEITLSTPTLLQSALNLGTAALADRNRPKTPGTITVRGYIRDRAGNEQPVWKVRAGDTIAITNFPNDTPRLIVETDYDDEQKQIRVGIDKPFQLLDAYLDRVGNALGARGLA